MNLPKMENYDQALAVSKHAGDHFFLCAFMLRDWVRDLMSETLLTYHTVDHRPCDLLQDGLAWCGFRELFPDPEGKDLPHALNALLRFVQYDDRFAEALLRAQVPLLIEEQLSGRPFIPQPGHSLRLTRRTAEFWCDWLEATIHLEIHRAVQALKRGVSCASDDLVAFGFPMCRLPAAQTPPPLSTSHNVPRQAPIEQNPSAGWLALLEHPRFPGEEIETLLIALQPLAKRYRWTSADFFAVLTELVRHAEPGFCWAQSDLETYRRDELGLPPLETCAAQLPGPPAGLALAARICPPNHLCSPGASPS